jgi:hypothetical protein
MMMMMIPLPPPFMMMTRIIQVCRSRSRALFSRQLPSAETTAATTALGPLQDFVQRTRALAFFPRAALLNHSCDPCCSVFYAADPGGRLAVNVVGSVLSCRTFAADRQLDFAIFFCLLSHSWLQVVLRNVLKGEELTISYGPCK